MKILIFASHPDDVEPQMGGTIAKYIDMDYSVIIYQLTSPVINGDKSIREKEARKAAQVLGASIRFMDFDIQNLNLNRILIDEIDKIILDEKPNRVFTCWNGDTHQDHRILSDAVFSACRKNKFDLILFEPIIPCGLTENSFDSNMFVDISNYIEKKTNSIYEYKTQLNKYGDAWVEASIARSKYNGFRIQTKYAEAFKIIKMINY